MGSTYNCEFEGSSEVKPTDIERALAYKEILFQRRTISAPRGSYGHGANELEVVRSYKRSVVEALSTATAAQPISIPDINSGIPHFC